MPDQEEEKQGRKWWKTALYIVGVLWVIVVFLLVLAINTLGFMLLQSRSLYHETMVQNIVFGIIYAVPGFVMLLLSRDSNRKGD